MNKILKSFIYFISWFIILFIVKFLFKESPAKSAYGFISAWWGALYISRIFKLKLNLIFYLIVFGIIEYIIYIAFESPGYSISDIDITMLIPGVLIFMSPFLINNIIEYIERIYSNLIKKKKMN